LNNTAVNESAAHVWRWVQWESRSRVRRPWAWLLASERRMGFWCGWIQRY